MWLDVLWSRLDSGPNWVMMSVGRSYIMCSAQATYSTCCQTTVKSRVQRQLYSASQQFSLRYLKNSDTSTLYFKTNSKYLLLAMLYTTQGCFNVWSVDKM